MPFTHRKRPRATGAALEWNIAFGTHELVEHGAHFLSHRSRSVEATCDAYGGGSARTGASKRLAKATRADDFARVYSFTRAFVFVASTTTTGGGARMRLGRALGVVRFRQEARNRRKRLSATALGVSSSDVP